SSSSVSTAVPGSALAAVTQTAVKGPIASCVRVRSVHRAAETSAGDAAIGTHPASAPVHNLNDQARIAAGGTVVHQGHSIQVKGSLIEDSSAHACATPTDVGVAALLFTALELQVAERQKAWAWCYEIARSGPVRIGTYIEEAQPRAG